MNVEKVLGMSAATAATVAGVGALGVLGWVQFRLYVRRQVLKTLNDPSPDGFDYDNYFKTPWVRLLGVALDIPSAEQLAESTTPIWSTVHPQTAFEDILEKGRKSKYWPKSSRNSIAPPQVDEMIFTLLRQMANQAKEEQKLLAQR